jgi:hypothetical protein
MAFDPDKPAESAPIVSAELREQFNGLMDEINLRVPYADLEDQLGNKAERPVDVAQLTQTISNPPTQAQVQALQAKLNELIAVLKGL